MIKERKGSVLHLTLNRPERRNALNNTILASLTDAILEASSDPELRAIVLTGAGEKAFCAGGDLKAADSGKGSPVGSDPSRLENPLVALYRAVEKCNLPIIGRINGHALGGGLGLVCICDVAVAVETAKLGTPEAKVGLFPMMILSYLVRLVPRRKLVEMSLTGTPLSAVEALDYGLLNHVVSADQLDVKVDDLINQILANSPTAIRLGKMAFRSLWDMSMAESFEYTQLMIERIGQTEDAKEGFSAFVEKRTPEWTGK
jgi:enoyl-CoA hydratase/carnithine racemase